MPVKESFPRSRQTDSKPLTIGIEFDQTNIAVALVDEHAHLVAERRMETPQRTTRSAAALLVKAMLDLAASKERAEGPIIGIGVSVAGTIDPLSGRVSLPGLKHWSRVPLGQMLEEHLNDSGHDIRTSATEKRARAQHAFSAHPAITIGAQASAVAAAEAWIGAARGKQNVVCLSIGNEIEAGILVGGRVLAGTGGYAGSAGWLAVSEQFRDEYQVNGCLSAEAAINALTRRAIEESGGPGSSMLGGMIKADASELTAATVIRAARGGDKLAVQVMGETCCWIGRGVANLISILNPEVVVIGGELGRALKPFLDGVREETRRWAAPEAMRQCRIVPSTVTDQAGVIGAARLAWMKLA